MSKTPFLAHIVGLASITLAQTAHCGSTLHAPQSNCAEVEMDGGSALLPASCHEQGLSLSPSCQQQLLLARASCQNVDSQKASNNAMSVLDIKWASGSKTLVSSLARLDQSLLQLPESVTAADLRQIQQNIDSLFNIQNQLAALLEQHQSAHSSARSWDRFSHSVLTTAESLRKAKQKLQDNSESGLLEEVSNVEAYLYEQAGYGFGRSGQYRAAADMWKKSADIAHELMVSAQREGASAKVDEYRYQRSTRLHRTREYWEKVSSTQGS